MRYEIPPLPEYGFEGDLADGGWAKPLGQTINAQTDAVTDLDSRMQSIDVTLVSSAQQAAADAAAAAGLVGAPAGAAVDAAIKPAGAARSTLEDAVIDVAYPGGTGVPLPTDQASIPVVRKSGDGRTSAQWEYIHNGGGGYLWHLMAGPDSTSGDYMFGIGLDGGRGNGAIFRNKAGGRGLIIEQTATVNRADAYGAEFIQKSTIAPLTFFSQRDGGTADVQRFESYVNPANDSAYLSHWYGYGVEAGGVRSGSGKLTWFRPIESIGSEVVARDGNGVAEGLRYRTKVVANRVQWWSSSGTSDLWFGMRAQAQGGNLNFQIAGATSDPDTATYTSLFSMRAISGGQISFFGATPVGRQSVVAAASDAATTQSLVNDLRAKLIALGLVQ